jgi:hypothetical protein
VNAPDSAGLRSAAADCVALVAAEYGTRLDWSVDSLAELDGVCASLLADGPLTDERLELWRKLIGAFAVSVSGTTAFPFKVADRVLRGEPYKSLASFARALPVVVDNARRSAPAPGAVGGEVRPPRFPVDPVRQPAIDEQILAGRFAEAIAAARKAYGLTMNDAFHGVLARKQELDA